MRISYQDAVNNKKETKEALEFLLCHAKQEKLFVNRYKQLSIVTPEQERECMEKLKIATHALVDKILLSQEDFLKRISILDQDFSVERSLQRIMKIIFLALIRNNDMEILQSLHERYSNDKLRENKWKLILLTALPSAFALFETYGTKNEIPLFLLNVKEFANTLQDMKQKLSKQLNGNSGANYKVLLCLEDAYTENEESESLNHGSVEARKNFPKYSQLIVSYIHTALKHNRFSISFNQDSQKLTLYHLGEFRHCIATHSHINDSINLFGKQRKTSNSMFSKSFMTYENYRYKPFFLKLFIRELERFSTVVENHDSSDLSQILLFENRGNFIRFTETQIYHHSSTRRIPATEYTLADTGTTLIPAWLHTSSKYIDLLLQDAQKLFSDLLSCEKTDKSEDTIVKTIAKIHWLLAQATPFMRGSAAISEWIIMALFNFHGYEIKWSEMPDCRALIQSDIEEYAREYKEFSRITQSQQITHTFFAINTSSRVSLSSEADATEYELRTMIARLTQNFSSTNNTVFVKK